jgi:hypothetical protein
MIGKQWNGTIILNHGKSLSLPNDAPLEKPGSNFRLKVLKICPNLHVPIPYIRASLEVSALAEYVSHDLAKIFFTSRFGYLRTFLQPHT